MTRKEVGFEEHIMSKDKYTSTFSRKIEAIVFLILKIFCNAREKAFTKQIMFNDKYTSALSFKYFAAREVYEQLTLFCVGCILMGVLWYYFMNKQTYLILYNIRSERKIWKLGSITSVISSVLAGEYLLTWCLKTSRARAKIFVRIDFSNTRLWFGWSFLNYFSSQVVTMRTNFSISGKTRVSAYKGDTADDISKPSIFLCRHRTISTSESRLTTYYSSHILSMHAVTKSISSLIFISLRLRSARTETRSTI